MNAIIQKLVLVGLLLTDISFVLIPPVRNQSNTLIYSVIIFVNLILSSFLIYKFEFKNIKSLIIFYFLSRTLVFPMMPWLSDDVFTYLWQGKWSYQGINVYEYSPDAPEMQNFRNELFSKMGNRDVPAIYPPITLSIFEVNHFCANLITKNWIFEYFLWKFWLFLSEFLALFVLFKFLKVHQKFLGIYILSPLPLIEIIGQGHNDGLLLIIISIIILFLYKYFSTNNKIYLFCLSFTISCGALIKIIPIIFSGIIFRFKVKFLDKVLYLLFIIIVTLMVFSLFLNTSQSWDNFQAGMDFYNNKAIFFSAPLFMINYILKVLNFDNWWIVGPKIIQFLKFSLILVVLIKIKPESFQKSLNMIILLYLITLLISVKVHPWYFAPMILLLSFRGKISAIIALSLSIFSYYPYLFNEFIYFEYIDITIWILGLILFFILRKYDTKLILPQNS